MSKVQSAFQNTVLLMRKRHILNLTLSAMFMALGLVLPFLTGQIPAIGNMLLPMHLPIFFCGLICGPYYGLVVGAVTPLLRSLIFSMPVLFPGAVGMAFELAAYGFFVGLLYRLLKKNTLTTLYISLISAMLLGRFVWGVAQTILLGVSGETFTFAAFLADAFTNAIPGLIIQLILIPAVMLALKKTAPVFVSKKEGAV